MSRAFLCCALIATAARADYMDHFVVRDDVGPRKVPSLGKAELVLIPVEVKGFPAIDVDGLGAFFSADSRGGFGRYYRAASLGRYTPNVTIAKKVLFDDCPLPAAQFPGCIVRRGDINSLVAGLDMMRETIRRAKANGTDFSKFDVNGKKGVPDGWADGVMVLLNTPFGGVAFPVAYFNREDNLSGGMGGPLVVDGVKIPHIAIAGNSDQWVMVHEFGHLLGLTDLYDESDKYAGLHLSWMGAWTYDNSIPLPDAESRFRLRWADWHQVAGRQRVYIKPVETSGEVWRLGTGDEYFLVENRGPGEFDANLTTRGLAVFHVDRKIKTLRGEEGRFLDRLLDCVNCDPWHPYIQWVQADGKWDAQWNQPISYTNDLFREGDELVSGVTGDPLGPNNQALNSNTFAGKGTGISISSIRVLPDNAIEVTLEAPAEGQCGETLCAEGVGCAPVTCADAGQSTARPGCETAPGILAALALLWLARRRWLSAS